MDLLVELYWSIRSLYSYTFSPRIAAPEAEYAENIEMKIVLPAPV